MIIGKRVFVFILLALAVLVSGSCMAKRNTKVAFSEGVEKYQWNIDASEKGDSRNEDARITSAIKSSFAKDALLSSSSINVDPVNGSVTLNGEVSSQIKADHAVQLGRSVHGVKRLHSIWLFKTAGSTKFEVDFGSRCGSARMLVG